MIGLSSLSRLRTYAKFLREYPLDFSPAILCKTTLSLLLVGMLGVTSNNANAASKKPKPTPKPTPIDSQQVFEVPVTYNTKAGPGARTIQCYKNVAGSTFTKKGVLGFKPLTDELSDLKKLAKRYRNKKKKLKVVKNNIATVQAVIAASKDMCTEQEHLSLLPYKGAFTEAEARILFDRFAFGGSPEQIAAAVAGGLDATVASLITPLPEPEFDALEEQLRCDGYAPGDTRDENADPEECPPGNKNAVRTSGVRFDIYERFWHSKNPFYQKFWLFLHDERLATSSSVLSGCDYYALVDHVHMLRRAAFSGDYRQYMQDWNNDYLGHLVWLDGASNSGEKPNENYGREFWELGTVGAANLDSTPVYNDLDIAQSALAFSGWTKQYDNFLDANGKEYGVCYGARAPLKHAVGFKRIFGGTPYEAYVDTDVDVLNATFNHPRTAESLAEDIWREFINPEINAVAIQKLALLIRQNNYNLLPVFKTVMASRAMYAAKSRKSLLKHPLELVFGFLRTTQIPVMDQIYLDQQSQLYKTSQNRYEVIEDYLIDGLGEKPTQPNTVFGWDVKKLAAELYIIPWRNGLVDLLNQNRQNLTNIAGFSYVTRFMSGLPVAGLAADALTDRLALWLGISLNAEQRSALITFLNNDYIQCTSNEKKDPSMGCDGLGNRLKRDVFDPDPAADIRYENRLRGALLILATLPQYRLK